MKLLMSDYEVTLVNDNMQVSSNFSRREGESSERREGGDKGDEQVSELASSTEARLEISSRFSLVKLDLGMAL